MKISDLHRLHILPLYTISECMCVEPFSTAPVHTYYLKVLVLVHGITVWCGCIMNTYHCSATAFSYSDCI